MNHFRNKKCLAFLLALCMCLSAISMPMMANAAGFSEMSVTEAADPVDNTFSVLTDECTAMVKAGMVDEYALTPYEGDEAYTGDIVDDGAIVPTPETGAGDHEGSITSDNNVSESVTGNNEGEPDAKSNVSESATDKNGTGSESDTGAKDSVSDSGTGVKNGASESATVDNGTGSESDPGTKAAVSESVAEEKSGVSDSATLPGKEEDANATGEEEGGLIAGIIAFVHRFLANASTGDKLSIEGVSGKSYYSTHGQPVCYGGKESGCGCCRRLSCLYERGGRTWFRGR